MFNSLWSHRLLIYQMSKRKVNSKYQGSILGILWAFIFPVIMLSVYTFVFAIVFESRWGGVAEGSKATYAIFFFTGLIIHGLLAECINTSPVCITSNVNYVKKVVFPLEILPVVIIASALFPLFVSSTVLLFFVAIIQGGLPLTVFFFPIILLPFILFNLGVAWFLSSLGVFLNDIKQVTGMLATVLLFMAPVFYPLTRLPEEYRCFLYINPLTFVIEQSRAVVIVGKAPNFLGLSLYMVVGLVVAYTGFVWFQKTRKGFADVL